MTNIKSTINYYRTRDNLSMSKLSNYTGVSTSTISRIENGLANPRFMTYYRILRYFNLDYPEVMKLYMEDCINAEAEEINQSSNTEPNTRGDIKSI